jgi:hypothetical protein
MLRSSLMAYTASILNEVPRHICRCGFEASEFGLQLAICYHQQGLYLDIICIHLASLGLILGLIRVSVQDVNVTLDLRVSI